MLKDKEGYSELRNVIGNATIKKVMTSEEVGFIVTLVERFKVDIEIKLKQLHILQGEINQLKNNEQIIVNLVENMIAATERQIARQDTMDKIRGTREDKSKLEKNKEIKDKEDLSKKDGENDNKEDF